MISEIDNIVVCLENCRSSYTLGEAIRKIRKTRGWQQKELAQQADISNTYLCDIEKNRVTPSLKTIQKLGENLLQGIDDISWRFFLQFNYVNNAKE